MRTRLSLCVLLCLWGCNTADDEMVSEPLEMTITVPTSQSTYTTNQSSVTVGGTLTGLSAGDYLPFASAAGVRNETNGALVGMKITGTSWEGQASIALSVGVNQITAYGHFQSGSVSDQIVITRN